MKLVIDLNLSPNWVDWLARHGLEAVHWSTIGAATAPDDEVLRWARKNSFVLVAHDLDFSAILAATAVARSSVGRGGQRGREGYRGSPRAHRTRRVVVH